MAETQSAEELVREIADILARYPCRADENELDKLRRFEVARYIVATIDARARTPEETRK